MINRIRCDNSDLPAEIRQDFSEGSASAEFVTQANGLKTDRSFGNLSKIGLIIHAWNCHTRATSRPYRLKPPCSLLLTGSKQPKNASSLMANRRHDLLH